MPSSTPRTPVSPEGAAQGVELAELRLRLREMEDMLQSIQRGDVDALIVNGDIYTLDSAHAAGNRMRQDVLSQMEDAVFAFDYDGHVIYLNAAAERRYLVSSAEVLGRHRDTVFKALDADTMASSSLHLRSGASCHLLHDGRTIDVESTVSQLSDSEGRGVGVLAVVRDVSERRRAERWQAALVELGDRFRALDDQHAIEYQAAEVVGQLLRVSRAGYATIDADHDLLLVRRDWTAPGVQSLEGSVALRDYGSFVDTLHEGRNVCIDDVRLDPRTAGAAALLETRSARSFVNVPVHERGRLAAVMFVNQDEVRDWRADEVRFIQDVADRTRAVSERARNEAALRASEQRLREVNDTLEARVEARTQALRQSEDALRQAQKMEAVGQLTGGIAHDFNNLLAAVSGSLQVLKASLAKGRTAGLERYINVGLDSVRRAAALTQRLLAFARQQALDPKPTDVNRLVAGMEDLIRRTVGPNVDVEVVGAGGLWFTLVDPSQLESSLLNLCINARDAMQPHGGRLTIETANKWLDERAATERELPPGQYVSLCVTDTGTGMPPELIKRVFDPFFTTKPLGQGTGLGLSMVYGFVRQSGGQVRIYSEVGAGTTMCLYLPRHLGGGVAVAEATPPANVAAGDGGTVLVVEDEDNIRALIEEVLVEAGYHVIGRPDGAQALQVLQSETPLDLLITDVGLPGGLNGRQVADLARIGRPALKVLFITGFAENAVIGNGQLEHGMAVLTKPFEVLDLTQRVHTMISTGR